MRLVLIAFSFQLLAFDLSAAEAPVGLEAFPAEFFPGLENQSPQKVYLEGLMLLYPGRVLDEAPKTEQTTTPREPLVETLPRGITYVRIYDLPSARTALQKHINNTILLIDLRYVYSNDNDALGFGIPFPTRVNLNLVENGKDVEKGAFEYPEENKRTVSQPVIVLVNRKTRGAIEPVLDALQRSGDIITVGTRTAGDTGSYRPIPGVEGFWVIDGETRAASGPSLLNIGLESEIPVEVTPAEDFTGYQLLESGYSAESILRTELPALNPHPDSSEQEGENEERSVDPILQRAVEVVLSLQILGRLPEP